MFDSLDFPGPYCRSEAPLRAPLPVGPGDRSMFLGLGRTPHLGRWMPCGWHVAVHRGPDGACWTHLYRVVPEPGGGVLALLHRAIPGDCPDRLLPDGT